MHPHLLKHIIEGMVVWTVFGFFSMLLLLRIVGFPETEPVPEEDNESTLYLDEDDDGSGLEPHRR